MPMTPISMIVIFDGLPQKLSYIDHNILVIILLQQQQQCRHHHRKHEQITNETFIFLHLTWLTIYF